ncbi:MAG TPA: four helix bundle protein [Vicinamibacterales bacterium]|nr:four helix bundle protein [Vicinamibacterales bacterium]
MFSAITTATADRSFFNLSTDFCRFPRETAACHLARYVRYRAHMNSDDLQARLDTFAVAVHGFARGLFDRADGQNAARQLIKASSAMAQNYSATCSARSHKEFTAKMGIVREESKETLKWLRYSFDTGLATGSQLKEVIREAGELNAIVSASYRTAEARERNGLRSKGSREDDPSSRPE